MTGAAETILAETAASHGLTVDELKGPSGARHVCAARQAAMVAMRQQGLTFVAIGRAVNRHHSTVIHAVKQATGVPAPAETEGCKLCPSCDRDLPLSAFWRSPKSTDGRHWYCRDCMRTRRKQHDRPSRRHGRRPAGGKGVQFSAHLDQPTIDALRTTADEFSETQSQIVERAVRRELARMWRSCRVCRRRPKLEGTTRCGMCVAAGLRAGELSGSRPA